MQRHAQRHLTGKALCGLLLVAMFLLLPEAWAEEPMFAIRLSDGGDRLYPVGDIQRIEFEMNGEAMNLVVEHSAGTDYYPVEDVAKIDFVWDLSAIDDPGEVAVIVDVIRLFQNQPNPFSPKTEIRYDLPEAGQAELAIYDVSGRLVRTLVDGQRPAGSHSVSWNGLDDAGHRVLSGVYFYNLKAPGVKESRRMILLP